MIKKHQSWPLTFVDWFTAEDIAVVWRGISFKKDAIKLATVEGSVSSNPKYKASDAAFIVSNSLYPRREGNRTEGKQINEKKREWNGRQSR